MIQYVFDQDTLEVGTKYNPSDKWNDVDWIYYLIVCYTYVVLNTRK